MTKRNTILHRGSMLAVGIVLGVVLVVMAWFENRNNGDDMVLNKIVKTASLPHSSTERTAYKYHHTDEQKDSFFSVRNLLSFQQSGLSEK